MSDYDYMNTTELGFNYQQATIIRNAINAFIQEKQSYIERAKQEPKAHVIEGLFDYVNACNISSKVQQQLNQLKKGNTLAEFNKRIKKMIIALNEAEFTLLKELLNRQKLNTHGSHKHSDKRYTRRAA
jgi:tRNA U34 5-carboxymethylaminomethyl modifying enzyme MnmG/GidA